MSKIILSFNSEDSSVTVNVGSAVYRQYPIKEGYTVSNLSVTDQKIEFDLNCKALAEPIHCIYKVVEEDTVKLTLDAEGAMGDEVKYPQPFINKPTDILLYPYTNGVSFRADDPDIFLPSRFFLSGGAFLSMGFNAFYGDGNWVLTAYITNADAALVNDKSSGIFRSDLSWLPEKGQWGYTREIRYVFGKGSVTEICRAYRKIAEEKGLRVTLKEKSKTVPALNRLAGAADVWVWNDDAMDLLYSEGTPYSVPSREQYRRRVEVAKDMKESGMDRVLWSIFNENFDRETIDEVKALGYLTTVYDIYTDVIPKPIFHLIPEARQRRCEARVGFWPDGIILGRDGRHFKGWALKCTDGEFRDQDRLCEATVHKLANNIISKRHAEYGIEGTFFDVTGVSPIECYNTLHPMTRRQSWECKRRLLSVASKLGEVCGTEIGCEDVVPALHYNEGMMSPTIYRPDDSGRRMTHLYYGDDVKETIPKYMLNYRVRVPLFELVYHDCVQSHWYWGDNQNCCPEYIKVRDNYCMLYGVPPIYSFAVKDWDALKEDILASYNRTVPLATELFYESMVSFNYLTEDMSVQQTVFSNGTIVTVNFGDKEYNDGKIKVAAGDAVVLRK